VLALEMRLEYMAIVSFMSDVDLAFIAFGAKRDKGMLYVSFTCRICKQTIPEYCHLSFQYNLQYEPAHTHLSCFPGRNGIF
jgi:hypothetical protein